MEAVVVEQPARQSAKRNRGEGRPFPKGKSGNPKGANSVSDRAAALYATMSPDFGKLTATDDVLLRRACLLLARSERIRRLRDVDVGLRMSGEARRLLQTLKRHAAPPDDGRPTLGRILRAGIGRRAGTAVQAVDAPTHLEVVGDEGRTSERPPAADEHPRDEEAAP